MNIDEEMKKYINKTPKIKTVIHWWDLYPGNYVVLNKEFQRQFFDISIKKAGNYSLLEKRSNINRKTIAECFKNKRKPQISTLLKLAKFVNYPLNEIESNIIEVSGLKPKFPFKLSSEKGSEIRSAFLSDGHIPKDNLARPMYCAFESDLHNRLICLCREVFGEFTAKTVDGHRTLLTRFPSPIGIALKLSGVPAGDKTKKNCFLPRDILLGSKGMQTSYLRRAFDDEGDVCFDNYGKRAVRLTRTCDVTEYLNKKNNKLKLKSQQWVPSNLDFPKNNLLLGEYLLLKKLKFNTKIYKEGLYKSKKNNITSKWRIQITQRDNLEIFSKTIGFSLKNKQEKLSKAIFSYKIRKFPNGLGEFFVIDKLKKINSNKGFFTFNDLGKEMEKIGRTYDLAGNYLKILQNKNIIKKKSRGVYVFK